MSSNITPPRIAITHGDINGIGYEVILKALQDAKILEMLTPVIYGSAKIAAQYRKLLDLPPVNLNQVATAAEARPGVVNIVNVVDQSVHAEPGADTPEGGKAALAALEAAVADLRAGTVRALVTAPINKHNIQSDTFIFPGHTEYLEASLGDGAKALMILFNQSVRVALVTTHLPIAKIPEALTREGILEKFRIFNRSLHADFGADRPRIAVLALNPHAGEDGLLGTEEKEIIAPAIADARAEDILAFGPYAADGFFGSGAFRHFDGVLAMYHDQGLAPFKTMSMDDGVNYTAGLPYVRTSPDHGTGYDIAGRCEASEVSMRNAMYAAVDILRWRRREAEAHANPLENLYRASEDRKPKKKDKEKEQ